MVIDREQDVLHRERVVLACGKARGQPAPRIHESSMQDFELLGRLGACEGAPELLHLGSGIDPSGDVECPTYRERHQRLECRL